MKTSSELVGFVGGERTSVAVESWTSADVHSIGDRSLAHKQPIPVVLCVNGARVVLEAGQLEAAVEAATKAYHLRTSLIQE